MKIAFIALSATLAVVTPAHAALLGTTANAGYFIPDVATVYGGAIASPDSFTIGTGSETSVNVEGVTFIDVDFADLGVSLVFSTVLTGPTWNSASFNGLIFSGTGFSSLTGATLLGTSTFGSGAFTESDIALVGNELRLDWNSVPYADGQRIDIAFTNAAVPEPASWAMLIAGFGLIGTALRRRQTSGVIA